MHPVPRRPLPPPPPLRAARRFFPHSPGVAAGGVEVYLVQYRIFSNVLGLFPLDTSSNFQVMTIKNVSDESLPVGPWTSIEWMLL